MQRDDIAAFKEDAADLVVLAAQDFICLSWNSHTEVVLVEDRVLAIEAVGGLVGGEIETEARDVRFVLFRT